MNLQLLKPRARSDPHLCVGLEADPSSTALRAVGSVCGTMRVVGLDLKHWILRRRWRPFGSKVTQLKQPLLKMNSASLAVHVCHPSLLGSSREMSNQILDQKKAFLHCKLEKSSFGISAVSESLKISN